MPSEITLLLTKAGKTIDLVTYIVIDNRRTNYPCDIDNKSVKAAKYISIGGVGWYSSMSRKGQLVTFSHRKDF